MLVTICFVYALIMCTSINGKDSRADHDIEETGDLSTAELDQTKAWRGGFCFAVVVPTQFAPLSKIGFVVILSNMLFCLMRSVFIFGQRRRRNFSRNKSDDWFTPSFSCWMHFLSFPCCFCWKLKIEKSKVEKQCAFFVARTTL